MRRVNYAASVALITLGTTGLLAGRSFALPLPDLRENRPIARVAETQLQLEAPSKRQHGVAAGGNGRELVGSEAVGPLVMTRARTPMAAALQRPATRIGALGEDRPPIGIGSTDRPRLVRVCSSRRDGSISAPSPARGASPPH